MVKNALSFFMVLIASLHAVYPQDATFNNLTVNRKLTLNSGLNAGVSNDDSPHIYRTSLVAGASYPFNSNGHLILQPRTSAFRNVVFMTGSTTPLPRMTIQHDGNVGIGTNSPTQKLDIFNVAPFNTNGVSEAQDHISLSSPDPGNGSFFGGITWKVDGGRRRAAIAATRENADTDYLGLAFFTQGTDGPGTMFESMRITRNGAVGIGTSSPSSKLTVKGDIHAEEVRVDLTVPGPDYVFEEDYDLPTLESIQNYIRENKHLPGVPSADEMEEDGIDLGVMNMLLLKKIEELTLHQIELLEMLKEHQEQIQLLKSNKK